MEIPHRRAASSPARLATRLAFFAAGFAMSCWAPLVPFAKARAGVNDATFGLLLLCVGIGSIVTMPFTGWISARLGSKPMILAAGFCLAPLLPVLALVESPIGLAVTLLAFGAALGTLDVAMNVHGIEVEHESGTPLMSGFHGMFSVGGFAGSGGITLLLALQASPLGSAVAGSALTLLALLLAWPRLLRSKGGEPPQFVLPHGFVIVIAFLAAAAFLVEGSILDWGALLIVRNKLTDAMYGGLGYMLFSIAMTVGRLTGDWIVKTAGQARVLFMGGALAVAGFAVLLLSPLPPVALSGFVLIGLGASNIVPVLFSLAGKQTVMPAGLAVAAVTTMGYAGVLAGPALLGFVSNEIGLPAAFWMAAALIATVPLSTQFLTRDSNDAP